MQLPKELVLATLNSGGAIASLFPTFEVRNEQKEMLSDVLEAYNNNKIAMIEAGTGCGKSMAYLIPALLFASYHGEKTVISTNTINLQEQLLEKDIPLLIKGLKLNLKVVMVKGMNNYVCFRKLDEAMEERFLYTESEKEEVETIMMRVDHMKEGSRNELLSTPSHVTWERVGAERDTCTANECPHFQKCFFFKARKDLQDAQILVVNHHLLFADLAIRSQATETQSLSILPPYFRLIIDEAHNIEDIATDYFAKKISRLQLLKTLGRLLADKGTGKLSLLKEKIVKHFIHGFPAEVQNIVTRLSIDLPGDKRDIAVLVKETFESLNHFLSNFSDPQSEVKFRFREPHAQLPIWKEEVTPRMDNLIRSLIRFEQSLKAVDEDIESLKNERLNEATKGIRHEVKALAARLTSAALTLESLMQPQIAENQVRWIEHTSNNMHSNTALLDASLDLSKLFVEQLFSKFQTVILSSATLTTGNKFDYFKKRFGLDTPELVSRLIEKIYHSPFNYSEQALLVLPKHLPAPNHKDFLELAIIEILNTLEASRGAAFILFTSYSMMKTCFEKMQKVLKERRFNLFKQGDMPRNLLLARFIDAERSVLFGTDSFWEGVDVAGDRLRAVIIVKLPFKVPSEPIIQARVELLTLQGKDPFIEYSLPQAIVKFKQGFGRLIRGKKDRGTIVILDSRLLNKAYGKQFLSSLPKCREVTGTSAEVHESMKRFFFHPVSTKKPLPTDAKT